MENNLEQLVEKSTKVRETISRALVRNFPVEQDFADFLAMDIVNQAIGVDALERYNQSKLLEKKKREEEELERQRLRRREERIDTFKSILGWTFKGVLPSILGLCLLAWGVTAMYSSATKSPYPRTYKAIPEHARFADTDRSSWRGDQVYGLSDQTNLCLVNYGTTDGRGGGEGSATTCIHRNKLQSLNTALENAVKTDTNGVIWNEPNGNGEVWEVTRNNYRFVITATKDETFLGN